MVVCGDQRQFRMSDGGIFSSPANRHHTFAPRFACSFILGDCSTKARRLGLCDWLLLLTNSESRGYLEAFASRISMVATS
jgi:hypothetical protein